MKTLPTITILICLSLSIPTQGWKGTYIQDDTFIRMQYKNFNQKLGKVHASACLYEITIKGTDVSIKTIDTFKVTTVRNGHLHYSSDNLKVIVSIDTVFQCIYVYNLFISQKLGLVFWARGSEKEVITETSPLKLLAEEAGESRESVKGNR